MIPFFQDSLLMSFSCDYSGAYTAIELLSAHFTKGKKHLYHFNHLNVIIEVEIRSEGKSGMKKPDKKQLKQITIFLSEALHKQIKHHSIECGETMRNTLTRWIEAMAKKEVKP